MKTAYLDCFSGVSGDMFLGALLDAGLSMDALETALRTLPLEDYHIEKRRESRNHIFGTRFLVHVGQERQPHRTLKTIREIIRAGALSEPVKEKSLEVFERLAIAESEIHNAAKEEVHFHEVGAVDSIIDIVGVVVGVESLGIGPLFVSRLPLASGFVDTRHGRMPLPAPAALSLLKGMPCYDCGLSHEMVTPTGAALLRSLASGFGSMPAMTLEAVGYGVGRAELPDRPNLLRLLIGKAASGPESQTLVLLETNVDDASPEWLGYLMDRLLEAGALDVAFIPVHMKKNRPGTQIQVMAMPKDRELLTALMFSESATLGVRYRFTERVILERREERVDSPWGRLRVKKVRCPDGSVSILPEYESCREVAVRTGRPLREIFGFVISLNR